MNLKITISFFLSGLISNSMCETQQEIEIIQKALNKISKMENKTAALSSTSNSGPASSARQTTTQQPRKTMRRGFFMTLLQQKANQVSCDLQEFSFLFRFLQMYVYMREYLLCDN